MRVEQQLAQTVVFLGVGEDHEFVAKGTGFLLGVEDGAYLVMARHVIDRSRAAGALTVRLSVGDDYELVSVNPDAWHTSATTDVAVLAWEAGIGDLDVKALATGDWLKENEVGPGDDVFFVGLFAPLGGARGQAITRFGNVSLAPGEPIPVRDGDIRGTISAWLVEARSWGGQSGSPAFIWLQPMRYPGTFVLPAFDGDPGEGGVLHSKDRVHLLGMVVGHFNLSEDETYPGEAIEGALKTNSGIAIVVPASDIRREIDILLQDRAEP